MLTGAVLNKSNFTGLNDQITSDDPKGQRQNTFDIRDHKQIADSQGSLNEIFDNGNLIKGESQSQFEILTQTPKVFDDSIEQFVEILKKTTQASEINIFSKDLIQIYNDHKTPHVALDQNQKDSIKKYSADFVMNMD